MGYPSVHPSPNPWYRVIFLYLVWGGMAEESNNRGQQWHRTSCCPAQLFFHLALLAAVRKPMKREYSQISRDSRGGHVISTTFAYSARGMSVKTRLLTTPAILPSNSWRLYIIAMSLLTVPLLYYTGIYKPRSFQNRMNNRSS